MRHRALAMGVLAAGVAAAAGCQSVFPTAAEGPQRVLVRDQETDLPVALAGVEYEFVSFGPRASVSRNKRGQIEVEPQIRMPSIDQPLSRPLPGENLDRVWQEYNAPAEGGPVFNPDGSWNTDSFTERSMRQEVMTNVEGYAFLPVIHAPIRFRECRLTVGKEGYAPVARTVRVEDLDRLADRGRTVTIYLAPSRGGD